MTQSIFELKKNRADALSKLTEAAISMTGGNERKQDERYWQPVVDKVGNGYAIIRFLDAPPGEDIPFRKLFNHAFQGPGGWYIENSLTTLGQADPVSEFNSDLWKSSDDDKGPERTQVRKQKRKLNFISNILVVKHPNRPEDEGKVFLYKYGKKIFDKLNKAMNPEIPDVEAFSPFDFWSGANFRLVINKDGQYRSYNDSQFAMQGPIVPEGEDQDAKIDTIWKSAYSLTAEIGPEHFKTYEELETQFKRAMTPRAARKVEPMDAGHNTDEVPTRQSTPTRPTTATEVPKSAAVFAAAAADESDDDDESYFQKLLNNK